MLHLTNPCAKRKVLSLTKQDIQKEIPPSLYYSSYCTSNHITFAFYPGSALSVVGNGIGDPSSNPAVGVSLLTNALGKDMNPFVPFTTTSK